MAYKEGDRLIVELERCDADALNEGGTCIIICRKQVISTLGKEVTTLEAPSTFMETRLAAIVEERQRVLNILDTLGNHDSFASIRAKIVGVG